MLFLELGLWDVVEGVAKVLGLGEKMTGLCQFFAKVHLGFSGVGGVPSFHGQYLLFDPSRRLGSGFLILLGRPGRS